MNTSNITDAKSAGQPSRSKIVVWTAVFLPVMFAGFCGLLLFFSTVLFSKRHRRGAGWTILHLTLVQMVFIVAMVAWVIDTCATWLGLKLKSISCADSILTLSTLMLTENWLTLSLALNRAVAIMFPRLYPKLKATTFIIAQNLSVWCITLALQAPAMMGIGEIYMKFWPVNACVEVPLPGIYFPIQSNVGVTVPIVLTGLTYATIYGYIRFSPAMVTRANTDKQSEKSNRRHLMTKILCLSFVGYVAFVVPSIALLNFAEEVAVDENGGLILVTFIALESVTFSFDPIFFFALSQDYRNSARSLLQQLKAICHLPGKHSSGRTIYPTSLTTESSRAKDRSLVEKTLA